MRAFRSFNTPFPTGMTQCLWPQHHTLPPSQPQLPLHHHRLLSVSPPMGKQKRSQTPSLAPPSADTTTTTATATAATSPSQGSSLTNSTTHTSAAAKIPFRSRKIRKVSSEGDATAQPDAAKKPPCNQVVLHVLPRPLTADGELAAALLHLRTADPHLSRVIDAHKSPSFQCLRRPFHALARSILYQQLALKAAATIYTRFVALCDGEAGVVPEVVLGLTPHQLRQIGVSGRKASYLHDLAGKFHGGILSEATVVAMDDKSLFSMLTMVKGIGAWSVHMFMIFSLHRPDVLPVGDLSIRKGVQVLYGLKETPRPSQMEELCERWRPYRSVGSWYMYRLIEDKVPPTITGSLPIAGGLPG